MYAEKCFDRIIDRLGNRRVLTREYWDQPVGFA